MEWKNNDLELITSILSGNPLDHRPDLVFGKLNEGLDFCILNNESVKNSFYLNLVINTGSIHEEEFEKGIANFSQQIILTELNTELSRACNKNLTSITSSTDFHCTIFNLYSEAEQLKDSELRANFFELLEIFLMTIYKFKDKLISSSDSFREKIQEIKKKTLSIIEETNNSVANHIEKKIFSQFHGNTLLPNRWPIGEGPIIQSFTVSNILKFVSKWYIPENMCLFIVGDIPASNELLVTHLSNLSAELHKHSKSENNNFAATVFERPDTHNIFSTKNRIGHKTMLEALGQKNDGKDSNIQREMVIQHQSINKISISIGVKLDICPLVDEGEIFMNSVDTIISNTLHLRFLKLLENLGQGTNEVSVSWDFYNSSRENCGWNTLSIVTDEKHWKSVFHLGIEQIVSICNSLIEKDEFDEVILITISDYKKAAEEEPIEDPKLVLDGLIDDWLCGSIPLSKKQEYQLFCKVIDRITPQIVQRRCNVLFDHIINYFEKKHGMSPQLSANIFVSMPLSTSIRNSTVDQENNSGLNGEYKINNSDSEFAGFLLKEFKSCIAKNAPEDRRLCNKKSESNLSLNEEYEMEEKMSLSTEFGIWDAFKVSTQILMDQISDNIKMSFSLFTRDREKPITGINHLNGEYSIRELDILAERISRKASSLSSENSEILGLPDDICDLGVIGR
ncbi:peptidase M16 inactive domain-containing protein [Cryptosporidium felis]|nr:peptidase M16 inactive domain-containing protein [Cryptosporidium felis]